MREVFDADLEVRHGSSLYQFLVHIGRKCQLLYVDILA